MDTIKVFEMSQNKLGSQGVKKKRNTAGFEVKKNILPADRLKEPLHVFFFFSFCGKALILIAPSFDPHIYKPMRAS